MKNAKFIAKSITIVVLILSLTLTGLSPVFASDDSYPYCITQVFHGDPKTQKGLYWSTNPSVTGSDVQIVLKTDQQPDFSDPLAEFSGTVETLTVGGTTRNAHKVLVTGLEPGKEYYYRVGDKERNLWSEPGIIKTEPEDSSSFYALIFADTQFWELREAYFGTKTEKDAFAAHPDAAFALNCGDMMDKASREEEWIERDRLGKEIYMNHTYMPVTGNHDAWNHSVYNHYNLLPAPNSSTESGVYYSFDYGNVHFIVVNSSETSDQYQLSEQQRNWIIADAKASDKTFKILAVHHPIFSGRSNPTSIAFYRDYFSRLITEAGIDVVFQGHTHCWSATHPIKNTDGTPVVATADKINTTINGQAFSMYDNPDGTFYLTLAMGGPKQNGPLPENAAPIAHLLAYDKWAGHNEVIGSYVRLDVEGNKLGIRCYNNAFETGKATVAYSYAVLKGELPADKTALQQAIDNAKALDPKDYTEQSYQAMLAALDEAEDVNNDSLAKQEEVDAALQSLENAVNSLVLLGDANGDGKIGTTDALSILKHISDKDKLSGTGEEAADVTKDGKISSLDALWILQFVAGSRKSF